MILYADFTQTLFIDIHGTQVLSSIYKKNGDVSGDTRTFVTMFEDKNAYNESFIYKDRNVDRTQKSLRNP